MYDRMSLEDIDNLEIDIITSVPIHKERLKERGYNQADIMAFFFSKRINIHYDGKLILRRKKTMPMKNLNASD